MINAWILHVQSTHHNISKISLLSKFCVKLALQSIYSSHQDFWQCVVQCSSLLPHIQQLNFQLQNMIECPFQYYGILYIISLNLQINPMVAFSDIIFSHILNFPNRFFHHHDMIFGSCLCMLCSKWLYQEWIMRECESVLYGAARTVSGVSNPGLKCLFIIAFVGPMAKHCKKKRHIHLKS